MAPFPFSIVPFPIFSIPDGRKPAYSFHLFHIFHKLPKKRKMKKEKNKDRVLHKPLWVDSETHQVIKTLAAVRGKTIKQVVSDLAKAELKK